MEFARRGDTVFNASTGQAERVTRLYEIHADRRVERDELVAGDIAGVVGLKDVLTGHTLAATRDAPVLESIAVPEPVIDLAIETEIKISRALRPAELEPEVREFLNPRSRTAYFYAKAVAG